MKKNLLIFALFLTHFMTQAQQSPQFDYSKMKEISTAYFEAYSRLDAAKMVTFYHDDIEYHDETVAGFGGKALTMKGKDQIKKAFETEFFPAAKKFDWQLENQFFSGNVGVFRGKLIVHYKGTAAGKSADETLLWTVQYVCVLHFKDGKIIKELDYVDYPNAVQSEK